MADYTLYYWPLPFRGQFVRAVLAHAGAPWAEGGWSETARVKDLPLTAQPVPAMAPPILLDGETGIAVAQLPAILSYLGAKYDLIPADAERAALTHKMIGDANDVLGELTCDGGREMWDLDSWEVFQPRLTRWIGIFAETGARHGLSAEGGTILGTPEPGLADLVSATLWAVMTRKLPQLRPVVAEAGADILAHAERLMATPALAEMQARTDAAYGAVYCGGQIERALRAVLEGETP